MSTPHLIASLEHVIEAATLAPSVHNTQPWRFVLRGNGFDLHADHSRQLPVLDPDGRQLHLSCGAALATARIAARALGLDAVVELLPDPADADLLGRLTLVPGAPAGDDDLALALAVLRRHTVRDAFEPRALPAELVEELRVAAEAEGAGLRALRSPAELVELEVLLSGADAAERHDPAYRQELASWVRDPATGDGIPPSAVHSPAGRGSSLQLRDFTLGEADHVTGDAPPAEHPDVVVLTTGADDPRAWLKAGQALGAVLLRAARDGVQAQPLGQVTDLAWWRARLTVALSLVGTPQLVLRLGYASAVATTPRRDLDEVLVEAR
ncbi:MAG: hypothetical protein JWN57_2754 [Frankiales bacterium]|jgi:hypothetical protein|nr:hypothetical protein [Frankiales bacterium]